ncbi:MAG: redoxin domain-containing protein [Anaerolineales bacterium]|nr:redoxin domain-containing protein [Anaerolineales bacterium]
MATDPNVTLNPPAAEPATLPKVRRLAWWQWLVFALLIALLGLVAFQMSRSGPLAAGQVGNGQPAPDFEITTFDGGTFKLADMRGKVVVINFWASWCIPCEEEAADLESTWQQYKDQGVVFVGVAYVDTEEGARGFIDRFGITYPNGPDLRTEISHRYRITGVPETFVVGQDGILRHLFVGPTTTAALQAQIAPLLAASN